MWLQVEEVLPSKLSEEILAKYRFIPNGSTLEIPIYLKTGVDNDIVLDDVVAQLEEIGREIKATQSQT